MALREPLMALLKAGTAGLHARIEQVVPLMDPALDRTAYRGYLERLHGYLGPLEERLAAHAPGLLAWGIDLAPRLKQPLLVRDLLALGQSEAALAGLPLCEALPAVATLEEAWGCLYVIEGSTLGGQVIQRALGPRLSLTRGAGLALLGSYGEATGARWRELTAAVARFDEAGCDRDAVVRGACAVFATQMAWLAGAAAA